MYILHYSYGLAPHITITCAFNRLTFACHNDNYTIDLWSFVTWYRYIIIIINHLSACPTHIQFLNFIKTVLADAVTPHCEKSSAGRGRAEKFHGKDHMFYCIRFECSVMVWPWAEIALHYNDIIMSPMASQITSPMIVYSTVYSGEEHRKHQNSASLAFVRGIHWWLVNSPRKGPVMWKIFPFDGVIMV